VAPRPGLHVLLLTYFFPPMGGAGVQRTVKFTRYLPEHGIVPTVVCADSRAYPSDDSLLEQIPPGTRVIRLGHTSLPARILSLQRRWRRSSSAGGESRRSDAATHAWRDRLLSAWGALQVPDDKASWARHARRAAATVIAQIPVDIVVSSSPPVSAHGTALRIAREADVPWVADFRDLWTGNPAYQGPAWRRSLDRRMERRWLSAADGLVTVSAPMKDALARVAGSAVPTTVIPNGYDEEDFTGIAPTPSEPGLFRIVHAGTFYGHQSPAPFLRGVQQWLDRAQSLGDQLRVRFIGSVGSRFDAALAGFERRHPGVLELHGYVDHAEALRQMVSADALLLVVGGGDASHGVVTGKIYEYLRAARPILLVGSARSEAARLVRDCEAGEVVEEERTDEIARILERWIVDGAAPRPDPTLTKQYERRLLTGRLADFLYSVHERYQSRS